jgi:hypothetical protein
MVAGDVVVLENNQTSGYEDGVIGLILRVEVVGPKCEICWVLMPNDYEVPFWPEELRKIDEKG